MAKFAEELMIAIKQLSAERVKNVLEDPEFEMGTLVASPYCLLLDQHPEGVRKQKAFVDIFELLLNSDKKGPRKVEMPDDKDDTPFLQVLSFPDPDVRSRLIDILLAHGVHPVERYLVQALELKLLAEFIRMMEHGLNIQIQLRPDQHELLLKVLTFRTQDSYWVQALRLRKFFLIKAKLFGFPHLDGLLAYFSDFELRYRAHKENELTAYRAIKDMIYAPRPVVNVLELSKKRKRSEAEEVPFEEVPDTIERLRGYTMDYYNVGVKRAKKSVEVAIKFGNSVQFEEADNVLNFWKDGKKDIEEQLRTLLERQDKWQCALLGTFANALKKIPETLVWSGVRTVLASATQCIVAGTCAEFEQAVWGDVVRLAELVSGGDVTENVRSLQESLAARFQIGQA